AHALTSHIDSYAFGDDKIYSLLTNGFGSDEHLLMSLLPQVSADLPFGASVATATLLAFSQSEIAPLAAAHSAVDHSAVSHLVVSHSVVRQSLADVESDERVIDNINDIRNGIFINDCLHHLFLHDSINEPLSAILRTPNFAMNVHDVRPSPVDPSTLANPPLTSLIIYQPEFRLTLQHFRLPCLLDVSCGRDGQDARLSVGLTQTTMPSVELLDFTYGMAALKTWGLQAFVSYIQDASSRFYHSDEEEEPDIDSTHPKTTVTGRTRREEKRQVRQRATRDEPVGDITQGMDTMDLVASLWRMSQAPYIAEARQHKAEDTNRKVEAWLQESS
ncbi:hypothetical protein EW146_g7914, partial [Bondarzewia mesenterica]